MQLRLYRWLTFLAGPFIDIYLSYRRRKGKEDHKRFPERLGKASIPRPKGTVIWVHAASVGEALSVLPLINALLERHSTTTVLITTGTVSSAKLLEERLPARAYHQYVPIDRVVTVIRFLDHWKPDLALWVESELWPNLIIETFKTGCQMIQVNARLSENSYDTWSKAKELATKMLSCFALTLPQSDEDGKRLESLGAKHIKFLGNLKYDAPPLPADPKETGRLLSAIGDRPLWLASSTHEGEESLVAETHVALKEKFPNILTIIAPRHPDRGKGLAADLKNDFKLNVTARTDEASINEETDVYIANTLGELGVFYRLSMIVFMGGSLVEKGGQNPLEAARLECAILVGPHTSNFNQIYQEMLDEQACIRVHNASSLAQAIERLIGDGDYLEQCSNAALELVESKNGIVDAYIDELEPFLGPLATEDEHARA